MSDPTDFELMERRAAGILSRLRMYEQSVASAGCRMTKRENGGMQDWVLSVRWVLARVGYAGELVLMLRLTRAFQDASFVRIARDASPLLLARGKPAVTGEAVELIYLLSLEEFLRRMERRGIPDDYRDASAA